MDRKTVGSSCFALVVLAVLVTAFVTGCSFFEKEKAKKPEVILAKQEAKDTADRRLPLTQKEFESMVESQIQAHPVWAISLEQYATEGIKAEIEKFKKEEKGQLMLRIQQLTQENEQLKSSASVDKQRILDLEKKISLFKEKPRNTQGEDVRLTFHVVVDYGRNLGEMIKAGKYDDVHPNVTQENFPISGHGKQEIEIVLFHFNNSLFHFNNSVNSYDAIEKMEAAGYRAATIEELLALGEAHPGLQLKFWIVALKGASPGSGVPVLAPGEDKKRVLGIFVFASEWPQYCRFAAVRNVP